jgi:hypothetical protein
MLGRALCGRCRLHPTEDLLDSFPRSLTPAIFWVPRRPSVDPARPVRRVLRQVGRDTEHTAAFNEVLGVVAPIREICRRFPRLHLERLPPYAPQLNPDEAVWAYAKGRLANGRPDNITAMGRHLDQIKIKADSSTDLPALTGPDRKW